MPPQSRVRHGDLAVLTSVFLVLFVLAFRPWSHGFDPMGYYAWLRTVVIDGNLDVANEFIHYGFANEIVRTSTGYTANAYNIGTAVLWSPFFLVVHLSSLALQGLGFAVTPDGYGKSYAIAISVGSAVYAFSGLLLVYHVARELCGRRAALLGTVGVWLATGVVFYMYVHPGMSHATDIFVNSLVLSVWFWTRHERGVPGWFALGLCVGLATLVRQQNAVLVLFPAGEWLVSAVGARHDRRALQGALLRGLVFVLGGLLVFAPQLYVWYRVNGQVLTVNPYQTRLGDGAAFHLLRPHFYQRLFSPNRSLYFYAPLLLPATAGLWPLRRLAPRLALYATSVWACQVYITSAWISAGGASFGQRILLNCAPVLILGLAALAKHLMDRGAAPRSLWLVTGFFIVWNVLLIGQYITDLLPHQAAPDPWWSVFENQVRVVGEIWGRFDELLARRFGG